MHIISTEMIGQTVVITLRTQCMDVSNAHSISGLVLKSMPGGRRVVVNLGALRHFDVNGFAEIMNWAGGGRDGAEVRLCSESGTVRALFELLRVDSLISLHRNVEDAIASFQRPARRAAGAERIRDEEQVISGQRIA